MRLICELYRRINSSLLTGKCVQNLAIATTNNTKPTLIKSLNNLNQPKVDLIVTTNMQTTNNQNEDNGAAIFIITVMCFYSLSIVFMVVLNIKFKIAFKKKGCCYEMSPSNYLYETQQEETKSAINLLFSNSSKLVSSIATVVPSEINDAYDVFVDVNKIKKSTKFEPSLEPNQIRISKSSLRSTTV